MAVSSLFADYLPQDYLSDLPDESRMYQLWLESAADPQTGMPPSMAEQIAVLNTIRQGRVPYGVAPLSGVGLATPETLPFAPITDRPQTERVLDESGGGPNVVDTRDPFSTSPTTTTTYDPTAIDISALQNLDLSNINLDNIDVPTYNELNAALTGGSVAPSNINELVNLYNQQVNLLSSVGTLENVDIDDRPYWYNTQISGALANPLGVSGEQFRAASGLPDSFSIYDSGQGINQQNAEAALSLLANSEDPLQALSQYYGIDFQRAENPDANYTNASKYGADSTRLSEFQSVIEPVLQKVIPYIQLTQGLRYDDALEYAYKNDPMISALYNQYGVDLFRQTDDGSTYFFDPISGTESRTIEVKNSDFRNVGLALTIAAASAILGPQIGKALGGTPLANATGKALAAGFRTVASGGDFSDVLKSMATAGVLDYGLSQLAENVDLQNALNEFGENFGIGTEVSLAGEYTTLEDGTIVLTETMGTQGNLGDLLAGVADAIQNPSGFTPSSVEEANVIWNLTGDAIAAGGAIVGENKLSVGSLLELLRQTKDVYDNANQTPPTFDNGYTITWDPNSNDPVIIDKDGNTVGGLPSLEDNEDDGGGGGGGGSQTAGATDAGGAEDSGDSEDAGDAGDAVDSTTTITTSTTSKSDTSYDNVIASQIWEAYQSETDPTVKDKLLQEYINYTGSDQPPVDAKPPEDQDQRGTFTRYYVDLDGNVQPYYEGLDIAATIYDTFEEAQDAANSQEENGDSLDIFLDTTDDSTIDKDTTTTKTLEPMAQLPTAPIGGSVTVPEINVPPTTCPAPWTKVLLKGDKEKQAGDLEVGDVVYTQHEDTLEWGEYPVEYVEVIPNQERIQVCFDDTEIVCSLTHKFYLNGKWVEAADIKEGDVLSSKTVIGVKPYELGDVVLITVTDAHTYVSEGVLSHNKTRVGEITGGTDDGGGDTGGTTTGGTDDGGDTVGGTDDGGDTVGGTDDGGDTVGGTDDGDGDNGGTSGTTDGGGGTNVGGTDTGGDDTTTGGTGGGTDTGGGDGDGEGTDGGSGTGEGGGDGSGSGTGQGPGFGAGLGFGMLASEGGGFTPSGMFSPQQFQQPFATNLTKVQLQPYKQSKDYLAELLARLQA